MDKIDVKQLYINYLKKSGKSEHTIATYSNSTPNKEEVKTIVKKISGTDNLYDILYTYPVYLIAEEIKRQYFDISGKQMYSNAVRQYLHFLSQSKEIYDFILDENKDKKEDKAIQRKSDFFTLLLSTTNYVNALRTKPFLLLAGISGTGKSQKVQELAFMTCPNGELRNEGGTTPGNYCLVEVKPNWHDSTELLGYYSALSGKYELTDFIRFAYKAAQNKDVPFFLCLDEMNLAPVEQYFAEYLSVMETRKKVGKDILSQYLLRKEVFSNCELQDENGDLYSEKDAEIITSLRDWYGEYG